MLRPSELNHPKKNGKAHHKLSIAQTAQTEPFCSLLMAQSRTGHPSRLTDGKAFLQQGHFCCWYVVGGTVRLMNIILQQMLSRIIISFLIIGRAAALTSLTYSNCPEEFTPDSYNSSLALDSRNLAVSVYGSLFGLQAQAAIRAGFSSGDLSAVQGQAVSLRFLLPFILGGSIFTLCFIAAVCCCTFDRRCPPCESWRRNYIKHPYSPCELRATMVPAIVFSAGILVATIVVFSSFNSFHSDLKMVQCGLYYSLDVALNGDQPHSWGGFAQILTQVQNTSSLLGAARTAINANLLGNEWIRSGMQTLQNMTLALYSNNQNSKLFTPNPAATPAATFTPLFISQKLGPNTTAGSMVNDIDAGLRVTQKLSTQAYTTYVSAVNLANSAQNITANTNSNLQGINVASSYLTAIQASVSSFQEQFMRVAMGQGLYMVQAVFGVILLGCLISLLGIISSHIFELFGCKNLVYGGWVLLGLMYFAVLGVLFLFLAVGGLSYSFCEYFGEIIGTRTGYVNYVAASASASSFNKFFGYLDVCFFQDGNILKKFELAQEMKSVSDVFLSSQTFLNMQTVGNSLYVDTSVAPTKIMSWTATVNSYGLGVPYDADPSDTSEENPYVSLAHLNLRTNLGSAGVNTTCAHDQWVFDATNCSSTVDSRFTPTSSISTGLLISPTDTLCISLNTRIQQSAPSIWTASDIAQRYLSVRSCPPNPPNASAAYDEITAYAQALTNYRDSRINLYKGLSDQLAALLSVANTYNNNLTAFSGSLSTFFSSVSSLNNLVTNQINGLTISANCTVIADSMRFFYNMYCVNFLFRSVKIVVSCAVMLVLMLGAVLVGSVFGLRYGRVEKQRMFAGDETEDLKRDALDNSLSSDNSQDSQ